MGEVLVLAEHIEGAVKKSTLELLTKARELGEAAVLFCGNGYSAAASRLAEFGAQKVYVAESAEFDDHHVGAVADVLATLARQSAPAAVLIAASADGKEIAARLAVRLEWGLITDAVDVTADFTCTQSIFGGTTIVRSRVRKGTPVITLRPNSFVPSPAPASPVEEKVEFRLSDNAKLVRRIERVQETKGGRPELTEAPVVVAGGRGVGNAENFAILERLADLLGGAVGASRAATDADWYPHQYQIGQTGKTVSPQLYVACGISGAIQHRAGMQTSSTIVVVNKDPEAPIFELADFGVVGDIFNVLPQLISEIERRRS